MALRGLQNYNICSEFRGNLYNSLVDEDGGVRVKLGVLAEHARPRAQPHDLLQQRTLLQREMATLYTLNCFKESESNNSDVRGFVWSSGALTNFYKWHQFRSICPLKHHEFEKW